MSEIPHLLECLAGTKTSRAEVTKKISGRTVLILSMSAQGSQFPGSTGGFASLPAGAHVAYLFNSSSEKQTRLFAFGVEAMERSRSFLLYIAGKQGVKGIRLSMKDAGIDVAAFEREKLLRIVDSEEWYLNVGRRSTFRPLGDVQSRFTQAALEARANGAAGLTVVSEMDMLVRKGYLGDCEILEKALGRDVSSFAGSFVCAYDERELRAAGVPSPRETISQYHALTVA